MYNPYGPQGNNQPPSSPPGPYGPIPGQQYPPGPLNPYYLYPGGPAQPYFPVPPPKKKKRGKTILIVLPILLVICSVSGWACANSDFTLFDGGMRITGFLAEPRVQATATYYASHYPFGMNVLFEDNLSTLSGKWKTSADCTNQGGALHVSATKAQGFYPCLSTYTPFFDSHGKYTYEVSQPGLISVTPNAGLTRVTRERSQYLLPTSPGSRGERIYVSVEILSEPRESIAQQNTEWYCHLKGK